MNWVPHLDLLHLNGAAGELGLQKHSVGTLTAGDTLASVTLFFFKYAPFSLAAICGDFSLIGNCRFNNLRALLALSSVTRFHWRRIRGLMPQKAKTQFIIGCEINCLPLSQYCTDIIYDTLCWFLLAWCLKSQSSPSITISRPFHLQNPKPSSSRVSTRQKARNGSWITGD